MFKWIIYTPGVFERACVIYFSTMLNYAFYHSKSTAAIYKTRDASNFAIFC